MTELKKPSVKSKVEAVLFSTGHRISLDEIGRLCRARKEDVLAALKELQKEYEDKQSSLMLVEEGEFWKFTVLDHFIPMIRKIVTETELSKTMLETLAIIAFKYPILQSDLIKLRTNKAYDHLVELEKSGYITRQKHGRTNLIKLTEKFFKYFDLTEEKLKEQFKDFDSIAKAIKEKEIEVEQIKDEQRKKAEDLKKEDEKIKKEIESLDKADEEFKVPLDTYAAKPQENVSRDFEQEGNLIVEKEKLGEMEIIEEEKAQVNQKTEQQAKQIFEQQQTKPAKQKRKSEGIKMTPEMEAKVNEKVEQILHSENQNKEEQKRI